MTSNIDFELIHSETKNEKAVLLFHGLTGSPFEMKKYGDFLFKNGYDVSLIEDLVINYNSEVKAGEKVELFIAKNDGKISVFGYKNIDTKVFACEMSLRQDLS